MVEKDRNKRYSDIINASEIGQFYFCSVSWYLQKKGFKPISKNLEIGTKKHENLGEIIDKTKVNSNRSKIFFILGIVILFLAFILFLFEVVL